MGDACPSCESLIVAGLDVILPIAPMVGPISSCLKLRWLVRYPLADGSDGWRDDVLLPMAPMVGPISSCLEIRWLTSIRYHLWLRWLYLNHVRYGVSLTTPHLRTVPSIVSLPTPIPQYNGFKGHMYFGTNHLAATYLST